MPAGQSGHCQCISQVNTDFFQNNTTNHNTILKYTTALAFYDSRHAFGYIIAILGCLESLSSLRVMYFNIALSF
jgi:hypothetical protein